MKRRYVLAIALLLLALPACGNPYPTTEVRPGDVSPPPPIDYGWTKPDPSTGQPTIDQWAKQHYSGGTYSGVKPATPKK